ncbi:MAG TPA: sensor histidine kinase [Pseudonocardiaceae bacterium]|nr:sensor histidine kinase [Pseudonocardiaceae bacterium]
MRGVRIIRPTVVDIAVTVGVLVVVVAGTAGATRWHAAAAGAALGPGAVVWLVACALPLLLRRSAPLAVTAVTAALTIGYYASGLPGGPAIVAPTVALVTLAYLRGPVVAGVAGGVVAVAVIIEVLLKGDAAGTLDPRLLGFVLWVTVAVSLGTVGRLRRAAVVSAEERVAEANRLRIEEQRLRIAREVHDVVAHSLAMINVQAGVAAHVADRRPEEAKAALLAIKDASRAALTDLRATLGVLRSGDERTPTPGLGRLPDLVATASGAGITVVTEGDAGPLPAPVDVAAYRILQECLTNVVRHAPSADTVTVRLDRTEDDLEITVSDNGKAIRPVNNGGSGLRGMAERANALGGDVAAGPVASGGFQVRARLPLTGGGR